MRNRSEIWQKTFNEKCTNYHIVDLLLKDLTSFTYRIEDSREIRLTTNQNMYNFSNILQRKSYEHVAKIFDCFKIGLPDQCGETQNVLCVVSEPLKRDFAPRATIQSGINLFRDSWIIFLGKIYRLDFNPYINIEDAYSSANNNGRNFVVQTIKDTNAPQIVKDIALAMDEAYYRIKKLDSDSLLFPFVDNIGLAGDGKIKICNIGHKFMGLDDNYEIYTTHKSVTVVYNPSDEMEQCQDNRMLIPLKVSIEGREVLVLGQLDTGATSSGFTESFFEEASLENFGITKILGATGIMDSIRTRCLVTFPNGYTTPLYGTTWKEVDNVSIVIGMDLLSRCKFTSEPYCNGFKYKITFPFTI